MRPARHCRLTEAGIHAPRGLQRLPNVLRVLQRTTVWNTDVVCTVELNFY